MGGSAAFELSLRGAELVLQHGRALLLVAERAELRVRVPQFALRARELRLGRRESVSDLQHLDVRRVDLFLAAGGGFGRPHRGELSAGRVELLLRHGELGVQADRFQLGFAEPQILLVVVDDAHRLLDRFLELRGQALALLRDGPQLELELLDLTLRAQRALLDPCVPGRRLGLAGEPLERLELFQRRAVLILQQPEPLLSRVSPFLGPPSRLAFLSEARVGGGGPHGLGGHDGPRLHATVGGVADHREEPSNTEDRDAEQHQQREQE